MWGFFGRLHLNAFVFVTCVHAQQWPLPVQLFTGRVSLLFFIFRMLSPRNFNVRYIFQKLSYIFIKCNVYVIPLLEILSTNYEYYHVWTMSKHRLSNYCIILYAVCIYSKICLRVLGGGFENTHNRSFIYPLYLHYVSSYFEKPGRHYDYLTFYVLRNKN